ncbi:hypothetical protein Tco_1215916 [Tanacetum coccineum]
MSQHLKHPAIDSGCHQESEFLTVLPPNSGLQTSLLNMAILIMIITQSQEKLLSQDNVATKEFMSLSKPINFKGLERCECKDENSYLDNESLDNLSLMKDKPIPTNDLGIRSSSVLRLKFGGQYSYGTKYYDCEIRYHPGKENVVADALSRKDEFKHFMLDLISYDHFI